MDAEVVAWALLVLGVLVMVVLAVLLGRHVRRLGRVRAGVEADIAPRVARLRAPGGGSSPGRAAAARRPRKLARDDEREWPWGASVAGRS